jgi:hypothetical protein
MGTVIATKIELRFADPQDTEKNSGIKHRIGIANGWAFQQLTLNFSPAFLIFLVLGRIQLLENIKFIQQSYFFFLQRI